VFGGITTAFVEAYPDDAARVLGDATPQVTGEVLCALPASVATAVLREMNPQTAAKALAGLAPEAASRIVRHLPVALAAALVLRLDAEERGALIRALPAKVSVPLRMVLSFPAGSVGSIIDPRVVTVRPETRVGEATEIARRAPALLRKYLYVLDDHQRLTGKVDARQCLLRDPALPIDRLDQEEPVALRARTSLREASRHPAWEHFSVLPATDHRGVFLGVVRRASLRRALAEGAATGPETGLAGLALDLADLYWQTAAGLITGTTTRDERDRGGPG